MITIKIQCVCGQRYAFDVDPGCTRMAWPISCPVCGADGTNSANAILASNNMAVPPAPPSEPLPASTAGPPVTQDKKRPLLPTRPPLNDNAARDLIEAKLHIKRAVSVALIMATVSFVLGLLSLFGYKILGASPFTLLHAGIVVGLGYRIHRFSRTCAVTLFLYYLADNIYAWVSSGEVTGIVIFCAVLYFFGRGALSTFVYNSLGKMAR